MSSLGQRTPSPGAALALGALAAAIAALPDVRRVSALSGSPGMVWLGLAGNTALVLGPLLVLARAARGESRRLRAVLIGCALAARPLALLAQSLKLHTHHRPLGAATFGVLALVLLLVFVAVTVRLLGWAAERPTAPRRAFSVVITLLACASLGLVTLNGLSASTLSVHVVDAVRLVAVTALASRALTVRTVEALSRRAGVLAWVVLVLLGLFAARGPVRAAINERAPVLGGPSAWL